MSNTPRLKRSRRAKPGVGSPRWFRGYRIPVVIGWIIVPMAAFWVVSTEQGRPVAPKVVAAVAGPLATPAPASPPAIRPTPALPAAADDAPHPGKAERWAYSGQLQAESGEVYSFYVAALQQGAGAHTVFHGALLDHESGKHYTDQLKVEGNAAAGRAEGFGFSSGGWQIAGAGPRHEVKLAGSGFTLDLVMDDGARPVAVLLDAGAAGKNHDSSRPRMKAAGSVTVAGVAKPVHGEVWFDHQWGDIEASTLRWNNFGLQLADGADLMIYELFDREGRALLRQGSYAKDGAVVPLGKADFKATARSTWKSPSSGVVYPMDWMISVPAKGVEVKLKPAIRHSQFNARATTQAVYWHGAVTLSGSQTGQGFIELAGYDAAGAPAGKQAPADRRGSGSSRRSK